jgi:hypothetical protein
VVSPAASRILQIAIQRSSRPSGLVRRGQRHADNPIDAMVTVRGSANVKQPVASPSPRDQLLVDPNWDPQTLAGDALLVHLN